jgi:hypothetical protein
MFQALMMRFPATLGLDLDQVWEDWDGSKIGLWFDGVK